MSCDVPNPVQLSLELFGIWFEQKGSFVIGRTLENPSDLKVLPEASTPIENLFFSPFWNAIENSCYHLNLDVSERSCPATAVAKCDLDFH